MSGRVTKPQQGQSLKSNQLETSYTLLDMHFLFLANTQIDWGAITESGLTAMVVTAVFVIIVKPLITQVLKNSEKSIEAYMKLAETIANGDSSIRANTKEAEGRVLKAFNELIEPITVVKENLRDTKEQLNRIEETIKNK